MSGKSNFPTRHRIILIHEGGYQCWGCGRSHADCLHHIFGRDGLEESSILNAAPLNNMECHLPRHGYWMTDVGRAKLVQKNIDFLSGSGYELTSVDKAFLLKYKSEFSRLKLNL